MKAADAIDAMESAQRIASRKATIPVLQYVRLEARDGGVAFTATDLEVTSSVVATASVQHEGVGLVAGRRFFEVLKTLAIDADVHVSYKGTMARVKSGSYRGEFLGPNVDEFPTLAPFPGESGAEIERVKLRDALTRVYPAVPDRQDPRYAIGGASLVVAGGVVTAAGTDTHRAARTRFQTSSLRELSSLIPRVALGDVLAFLNVPGDVVEVAQSDRQVFFRLGARELSCVLLEGKFPNVERFLVHRANQAIAPREALDESLRRVSLTCAHAESRYSTLVFEPGRLTLASKTDNVGDADETIAITYEGEPFTTRLKTDYVTAFLATAQTPEVAIEFDDPKGAVRWAPIWPSGEDVDRHVYVTMPAWIGE